MKWEEDLLLDIRINDNYLDNKDDPWEDHNYDGVEVTQCNRDNLLKHFLKVRDNCRAILEIGVFRNAQDSSSYVLLNNKLDTTYYIGIDLEDKSFLNDDSKRIYTIAGNSSNIDENMAYCNSLGITEFDFIFIDGWHSINQVLADWEYTKYLGPNGIVGFHDVNHHPGPKRFIKSLDRSKWNVDIRCPNDWGIAFTQKRKD